MFRWYRNASCCYVYLSDVPASGSSGDSLKTAFKKSRWFTRGWTLQELLAPRQVKFFSEEGNFLGDKTTLADDIHEVTHIPLRALHGSSLRDFSRDEIMQWAKGRDTHEPEDQAYSLLGVFGVSMALIYGEGANSALKRLRKEIEEADGAPVRLVTMNLSLSPSLSRTSEEQPFKPNRAVAGSRQFNLRNFVLPAIVISLLLVIGYDQLYRQQDNSLHHRVQSLVSSFYKFPSESPQHGLEDSMQEFKEALRMSKPDERLLVTEPTLNPTQSSPVVTQPTLPQSQHPPSQPQPSVIPPFRMLAFMGLMLKYSLMLFLQILGSTAAEHILFERIFQKEITGLFILSLMWLLSSLLFHPHLWCTGTGCVGPNASLVPQLLHQLLALLFRIVPKIVSYLRTRLNFVDVSRGHVLIVGSLQALPLWTGWMPGPLVYWLFVPGVILIIFVQVDDRSAAPALDKNKRHIACIASHLSLWWSLCLGQGSDLGGWLYAIAGSIGTTLSVIKIFHALGW